jgi:ABC-2 type transport system ATP-binding protein
MAHLVMDAKSRRTMAPGRGGGPASGGVAGWTLRVQALVKTFGQVRANDGICLQVSPGEVYGLLGPNGAGKSTLARQTVGLLKPDSGRISLGGHDLVADPDAARLLCSYLPQAPMPDESLRVREAIELAGQIRGGGRRMTHHRAGELIGALEIGDWRDTLGHRLPAGVRRLAGFCMAAVCPGQVVVLDEPTNDVDPLRRRLLWEQVGALRSLGCAVLLLTHNVMEAEKTADRLAILGDGRIVAEGTASSLKAGFRSEHGGQSKRCGPGQQCARCARRGPGRLRLQVTLVPGGPTPQMPEWAVPPVRVCQNLVIAISEADAAAGIGWAAGLVDSGVAEDYALGAATLEDVYIRLTGHVPASDLGIPPRS